MGRFSQIADARKPPATCLLPPSAFADAYLDRPNDTICIGLRTIAESDVNLARANAQKWADKSHQGATLDDPERWAIWVECYNDALLRWIVARGTCDPNDVSMSPEPWAVMPEDQVRDALTSAGVLLVYDAWERMRVSVDPTRRFASDSEILEAIPRLIRFTNDLPAIRRGRFRRMMAFLIDELASVAPENAPPPICPTCSQAIEEIGVCPSCLVSAPSP